MARLLPLLRRWVEDVERDAAEVQTKTSAAIEVYIIKYILIYLLTKIRPEKNESAQQSQIKKR